ncbi:MAG TPA: hypothetical protein VFA34_05810 [Actinomycetota bacterium]|jgi:hypothetical protein|nr:hypothetical protein [Actinomycetota bacterium]
MNGQIELQRELGSWIPLIVLLSTYAAIVVALAARGRGRIGTDPRLWAKRIADSLERLTRIPGWAAAMVGTATFGVLVAGIGFYSDVRWHVSLGRDDELFTAPHTAIVFGLMFIFGSAFIGEFFAHATKADVGMRVFGMRIPYSALAMGLIGACALAGFPLDELWHRQYGIDVTMWSPTHLLMIVGAVISPLASWLALGEAGVRPEKGRWATGVHIAVGSFALLGLNAIQGEFAFGVPQFQQLYHPVLYALAAGFGLTTIALVTRKWWATLIVAGLGVGLFGMDSLTAATSSQPRAASLYVVAALAVAAVGRIVGTERRARFAVGSGIAVATIGLAAEWAWSQGAHQPWGADLLPEAPLLALVVAIAAATVGVAFAAAVRREPIGLPPAALATAGVVILVGLALPLPRPGLDARADVTIERVEDGVLVRAAVTPADAADDARWFQALAWQGGGMVAADMEPTGEPGVYRTTKPVPARDDWKTLLRLHTGAAMTAIPIWLPADPEIGAPEVPAVDRSAPFLTEQRYLLREQKAGPSWFAIAVYLLLAGIAAAWVGSLAMAARSLRGKVPIRAALV